MSRPKRLSLEDQALVGLSRFSWTSENHKSLDEVLSHTGFRWPKFEQKALDHGLAPLVFYNLTRHFPSFLPKNGRTHYQSNLARNLFIFSELDRVLEALNERGLDTILMKGACFAQTLYPDPTLRPMEDVDLLCKEEDFPETVRILASLGFRPFQVEHRQRSQQEFYERTFFKKGHILFTLDLHRQFGQRERYPVDYKGIWSRARPLSFGERRAWQMSPEDTLIQLSIHHAMDSFQLKFVSVVDLRELVQAHGDEMDWEGLVGRAKACGAQTALFYCLLLSAPCRVSVPEWVLEALKPPWLRRSYLSLFLSPEKLDFYRFNHRPRLAQSFIALFLMDRLKERVGFLRQYLGWRLADLKR